MTTTPVTWLSITEVNDHINDVGTQREPRITELTDGRILVSYRDSGDNYDNRLGDDFVGQLFEMDGTAIGQPFLLNTVWNGGSNTGGGTGQERGHDIVATEDGGWIIVYQDNNFSSTYIRMERFDANGQRIGNGSTIASGDNANGTNVSDPSIDRNAQGDMIVTFAREDGGGTDTEGWSIEITGNTTTTYPIDDFGSRSELNWIAGGTRSDTAILSNGDIVTVNEDYSSFSANERVNIRVNDPDGTTIRSFLAQTSVNNWNWNSPRVEALEGGGFVVTYRAVNNNADDYGIRVAVYNNSGQQVVAPFYAAFDNNSSGSSLRYSFSDVVALDNGEFLVGWIESGSLHVRRYDGLGGAIGNELILSNVQPGFGSGDRFETFEMTHTQDGRVMLTWSDYGLGGPYNDNVQFMILDTRDDGITITGTNGVDALTTPNGGGTVNALGGADNVLGRGGDDTFIDTDFMSGDHYNGRLGIDTIDYSGVNMGGTTTIDLVNGVVNNTYSGLTDTLENIENISGSQGNDIIITNTNTRLALGNGGDDRIVVASGFNTSAVFNGGGGTNDTFDLSNLITLGGYEVNLLIDTFSAGIYTLTATGFENIWGSDNFGIETLIGDGGDNEIRGFGGTDHITGNSGVDELFGGSGDDVFYMSRGHLSQGETVDGELGTDTISLTGTAGTFELGRITTLASIEQLTLDTTPGNQNNVNDILNFNANQFGTGITFTALFTGNAGNENINIFMGSDTQLDLSGLQFNNWDGSGFDIGIAGDGSSETIIGSSLSDQIVGGGGDDIIDGGSGGSNDWLNGGTGTNTVSYASASAGVTVDLGLQGGGVYQDTIGAGTDRLEGFQNLTGSAFNDILTGIFGANIIHGGDGNDEITGNGGGDFIYGDGGNDKIFRAVTNQVQLNKYDGGSGIDTFVGNGLGTGDVVDFANGVITRNGSVFEYIAEFENYEGFDGDFIGNDLSNHVRFSFNYANIIDLGKGDDIAYAGSGNDVITGGDGLDAMYGEAGNDTFSYVISDIANGEKMDGGSDQDSIRVTEAGSFDFTTTTIISVEALEFFGGKIDTQVIFNQSQLNGLNFTFNGNLGANQVTILMDGYTDADLSQLSFQNWSSDDIVEVSGNSNDNYIRGYFGVDSLHGGIGNDTLFGSDGADILDGDGDVDTATYEFSNQGVDVSLTRNSQIGGDAQGDRLIDIENLTGSAFSDILDGDSGDNILRGLAGDDILRGGAGFDKFYGGAGINRIDGGDDIDHVYLDGTSADFDFARFGNVVMSFEIGSQNRTWSENIEFFNVTNGQTSFSSLSDANGLDYIASNVDLMAAFGTDAGAGVDHYFNYGYYEGREVDTFDEWSYIASNLDLYFAFGNDTYAATGHYINYGYAENRATDTFDEWSYLASNTDVLATIGADGLGAVQHYVNTGISQGRPLDTFDEVSYLASHVDLINAFGFDGEAATMHYVFNGFSEGRAADSFDEISYLASNTDLIAAFGSDRGAATAHYVQYGYGEGRAADSFDEWSYLASNADLLAVFGSDGGAATNHYVQYGYGEGRALDTFDEWSYLASNVDLINVFGSDGGAATIHYVVNGFGEGRQLDTFDEDLYVASNTDLIPLFQFDRSLATQHYVDTGYGLAYQTTGFDAVQYLANYADLQAAFGTDYDAAIDHFIEFGFDEGRTDAII